MLSEEERKARLAYWIRDIRFRRGLTPPKLADLIGTSRSTVNKWESGEQIPSMIWLGPLAQALRVDPRLFAELPAIPQSAADDYLIPSDDPQRAADLARGAVELAHEDLEQEAAGRRAAAKSVASRRGKRSA